MRRLYSACLWSFSWLSGTAQDLEGSVSLLQLPGSIKFVEHQEANPALLQSQCSNVDRSASPSLLADTDEVMNGDGRCSIARSPQLPSLGFIRRATAAAQPSVMVGSDGFACAVSHTSKFIFVHVPKNAGTTSYAWLQSALCGEGDCDPCSLEFLDCHTSLAQFTNYVRWSWVRHPYDRAVSIYSMATSEHMAASPAVANITLEDFWLHARPWLTEAHNTELTKLSYHHGLPQSAFVADEKGCLAVDFLGSLDRATEDMSRLARALDAQPLVDLVDAQGFNLEINAFGDELEEEEGLSARQMVEAAPALKAFLDDYYAADFALLGSAR